MQDTQKILRNWKMVWTILAIIVSIFIFQIGIKYNFIYSSEIGWKIIKLDCSDNIIGKMTECKLTTEPSSNGIIFHFVAGLIGFFIIQLLHIPIWILRRYLIR